MATTLSNMGLRKWNLLNDPFSYSELAANWDKVDTHDHSAGKGVPITASGLASGAVTAPKIGTGQVGTAALANLGVTSGKIANGAVGPVQMVPKVAIISKGTLAARPASGREGDMYRATDEITYGNVQGTTYVWDGAAWVRVGAVDRLILLDAWEATFDGDKPTFLSIPQLYKGLQIRGTVKSNNAAATANLRMWFNGELPAIYCQRVTDTGVLLTNSSNQTTADLGTITASAGGPTHAEVTSFVIDIPSYYVSAEKKSWFCNSFGMLNDVIHHIQTVGATFGSYSPITQLQLDDATAAGFWDGSRISLYAIS